MCSGARTPTLGGATLASRMTRRMAPMSSTTTTSSQDQAHRVWGTLHRRTIRVAGSSGEREPVSGVLPC